MKKSCSIPIIALVTAALISAGSIGFTHVASAQATEFTLGAAGIGDPYYPGYGNGGYDVINYDIDVDYDPGQEKISGSTTIQARALQGLSSFNLDFLLDASQITVDGKPASSRHDGRELTITPSTPISPGNTMTVVVRYSGYPTKHSGTGYSKWLKTDDGGVIGVGEPTSAPWWFLCNDHPRDKATMKTSITVPKEFQAIAAGAF